MSSNISASSLMLNFLTGMKDFLQNQSGLKVLYDPNIEILNEITFKKVTSFIPVNNGIDMHFVLSLDEELLMYISAAYLDLDVVDVTTEDGLEMAGELNNIVLGLSMSGLKDMDLFSPPNVILDKTKIEKRLDTELYGSTIKTPMGELSIYFMGPVDSFNQELDYIGESV